jgi:hypothetical protein
LEGFPFFQGRSVISSPIWKIAGAVCCLVLALMTQAVRSDLIAPADIYVVDGEASHGRR